MGRRADVRRGAAEVLNVVSPAPRNSPPGRGCGRDGRIRTCGHPLPKRALYQTELRPVSPRRELNARLPLYESGALTTELRRRNPAHEGRGGLSADAGRDVTAALKWPPWTISYVSLLKSKSLPCSLTSWKACIGVGSSFCVALPWSTVSQTSNRGTSALLTMPIGAPASCSLTTSSTRRHVARSKQRTGSGTAGCARTSGRSTQRGHRRTRTSALRIRSAATPYLRPSARSRTGISATTTRGSAIELRKVCDEPSRTGFEPAIPPLANGACTASHRTRLVVDAARCSGCHPAASSAPGRGSLTKRPSGYSKCRPMDSNQGPPGFHSGALPTELDRRADVSGPESNRHPRRLGIESPSAAPAADTPR